MHRLLLHIPILVSIFYISNMEAKVFERENEMKTTTVENKNSTSNKSETTHYSLKVGRDAMPRLKRLNDMCNPLSLQFIAKHIDLKNKKILDLGCGIGILSSELAKRSLPNGSVMAVDQSQAHKKINTGY